MDKLNIKIQNSQLVVDSRLVAKRLEIEHRAFIQTIKKYQVKIEQRFGVITFEMSKPPEGSSGGRPESFAYLTEPQATALMTFSRNTDAVVDCKLDLVEAFENAKKLLESQKSPTPSSNYRPLLNYTRRVLDIQNSVRNLCDGYWCVFVEAAPLLIYVETQLNYQIDEYDLLDGSVGIRWSQYRKGKPWADEAKTFTYKFPDNRGFQNPKCYPNSELLIFRNWLETEYRVHWLENYLSRKYRASLSAAK